MLNPVVAIVAGEQHAYRMDAWLKLYGTDRHIAIASVVFGAIGGRHGR